MLREIPRAKLSLAEADAIALAIAILDALPNARRTATIDPDLLRNGSADEIIRDLILANLRLQNANAI